jgi:transposase
MATLSMDLRERIVLAYDVGGSTRQDIADRFCVSLGMVKKLLGQRKVTGDIAARHHRSGRKPKITTAHKEELRRRVADRPDITLEELRDVIGVSCSLPAIHYVLSKMGRSYKKRRLTPPSKSVKMYG